MVSCAVCGCSYTSENKKLGITFHRFPKNVEMKKRWIRFMRNPEWTPKPSSVLCSQHFIDEYFDRTSQLKVRLLPNAVPTIEVDRLKYVRTFNPVVTRMVDDVMETSAMISDEVLQSADTLVLPGPSTPPSTSQSLEEHLQDTPRKRNLKRKITELSKKNILKSKKIRKLQKVAWHQKKIISTLRVMLAEIKKRNLLLEEQESVILDSFGANKEIIERLFKKPKNKE